MAPWRLLLIKGPVVQGPIILQDSRPVGQSTLGKNDHILYRLHEYFTNFGKNEKKNISIT